MADQNGDLNVFADLLEGAEVAAQLAKDEKAFSTLYETFRASDSEAFQRALAQLNLVVRCRRVCELLRAKHCFFVCTTLCGRPGPIEQPNPRQLAEAVVKMTANADMLKQLEPIFGKRDVEGFKRLAAELNLGPYCRIFCHWICHVYWRLVCKWICSPVRIERPNFIAELQLAGRALEQLLKSGKHFDEAFAASNAGDTEKLAAAVKDAGLTQLCYLVCEWFCSWRCVLVTTTLCREYTPVALDAEPREAFQFVAAVAATAQNPAALRATADAIATGDAAVYQRAVGELKLLPFCFQWTHWVCGLRCWRLCRIVCPGIFNHPWFTHVGDFGIVADISGTSGLTNKAQAGHGGPLFGFAGCMSLRGFCPKTDPAHAGAAMAYRFLYQAAGSATATPITGGFVCEVLVGTRYALWNGNPFSLQSVRIRGAGATSPTPPVGPPSPTPPDHYIVPDAQGWVPVDQGALDDGFNGWLMGFSSPVAIPGGDPAPGVAAGTAVPAASQKNGTDVAILFQATRVSTLAAVNGGGGPDYANTLGKIHINNWTEVNLLDLQEFIGPGSCTPLSTALHINYTTDHELLASWSIDMVTAATVTPAPTFPSGTGPRGAAGTDPQNITSWPQCSYLLRLHTQRSITDGLTDAGDWWTFKTFCIGKKP